MLFSATMPPEIMELVNSLLKRPVRVAVSPISSPVEAIRQSVCMVDRSNKTRLLAHLVTERHVRNALVFTRTKHGANKVARDLEKLGISAAAIHGNKSQAARQQALHDFKEGSIRCLVATDIAARGLDIEDLSHVFNYNLPEVPETYVHRIGRTGRAGRDGEAISFCDIGEVPLLQDIEKLLGHTIPRIEDHPFPMADFEAPARDKHGRIVNEEDAEARAAAREQHRARDEARKAAAKEKRQSDASAAAAAAQILSGTQPQPEQGSDRQRSRRREKTADPARTQPSAPSPSATPPAPPRSPRNRGGARPAPEPDDVSIEPALRHDSTPHWGRPGTFFDTGDSLPNTDFERPDPLAGDFIMDATARLLAPRGTGTAPTASASPAPVPRTESRPTGGRRSRNRRNGEQNPPSKDASRPEKAEQPGGKKGGNPQKKQKKQANPAHGGRDTRPKDSSAQPRRSRPKDSTQQESLMKPFYLEP